jgi:hypothetical protein
MKKILCYSFGILGILSGLMLMYCVFTGETNQRIYLAGSIELFASTTLFLLTLKLFKLN